MRFLNFLPGTDSFVAKQAWLYVAIVAVFVIGLARARLRQTAADHGLTPAAAMCEHRPTQLRPRGLG